MGKCIILAPLYRGEEKEWLTPAEEDFLICADGGYARAQEYGFVPDLLIGDFDSMPENIRPTDVNTITLPVHKDDTDMVVCLQEGRKRGYRSFLMAGCLGGRFCHSIANLQCLYDCALRGENAWMCDAQNRVTVLLPGIYTLKPEGHHYLSLLSYSESVKGLTVNGCIWNLKDAAISNRYPLGVSNQIVGEQAVVSFTEGALIVVLSNG